MVTNIDRFDIEDVAKIHDLRILRKSGAETFCECPFCGNTKGKFSYIVKKGSKENIFHCYHCDEGGSSIDLHMKLSGETDRKTAVKQIFAAIRNDEVLTNQHFNRPKEEASIEAIKRDDAYLSKVYRKMLRYCILKKEHKADLLRRGLTERQIEYFAFKSIPSDKYGICRKLIADGFNLEGVPGFYKKDGKWLLNAQDGYFCPVYNMRDNTLRGFQIHVDKPIDKAKYVWLSSAGKEMGCSSNSIASFYRGKNENVLVITEGILKSLLIYVFLKGTVSVIGIAGVKCRSSLEPYLSNMSKDVTVFEAFDMDKADPTNLKKTTQIATDTKNLSLFIKQEYGLTVFPLAWDFHRNGDWKGNFKGLDDFLMQYPKIDKFISYLIKRSEENREMNHLLAIAK